LNPSALDPTPHTLTPSTFSLQVAGVRATRDPVERTKKYCFDTELVSEAEIKEIEKEVKAEVSAAVEAAKASSGLRVWVVKGRGCKRVRGWHNSV
jgi:TPP-dependent pyruvate/acetoin dehydrogenase alpha subunit